MAYTPRKKRDPVPDAEFRDWAGSFHSVREQERIKRLARNELLQRRERIIAKIKKMQMERGFDPAIDKALREFQDDTRWINPGPLERQFLDILDPADPGRIKVEQKKRRPNRLVALYTRLFGRKAGTHGLHGEDDQGVLPDGGAAVGGIPTDGLSEGGESDADASRRD